MKAVKNIVMSLLVAGACTLTASAQEEGGPPSGDRPGRGHRPPPPLIVALDANHDGVVDATEIANASAALKTLDKNADGQLTREELMPPRREGTNSVAGSGEPRKDGHRPPAPPIYTALDANQDGVIDASEIANASTAMKALDKNGDGRLTREELMPRGGRGRPPEGGGPPPEEDK